MPAHEGSLAGKAALVTGGSRRIGRLIALKLAAEGAAVAVNARTSRAEVDAVVGEITAAGGKAAAALADITDPAENAAMVETAMRAFGRLDIVVHGAVARQHAWQQSFWQSMRPYASGQAYQNYVDPALADWRQAYYGANLARLTQVKAKYDPNRVFTFPQAI